MNNKKDEYYEKALNEIETENYVKSTYAKAVRYSNGDDSKIKSLYIEYRVNSLLGNDYKEKNHSILERFGEIFYVLAITSITIFSLSFLAQSISEDAYQYIEYKAKCLSNGEYVVLQGNRLNDYEIYTKRYLSNPLGFEPDPKVNLNFYCEYYDEIQVHVKNYFETSNITAANIEYFNFKNERLRFVHSYPKLYELEPTGDYKEFLYYGVASSVIDTLAYALGLFVLLQFLKIIYVYIAFGELVLHPFRMKKKEKL